MKVSELIEKLRKLPQDVEVVVVEPEHWEGEYKEREPLDGSTGLLDGRIAL
jgi:hypothetical protein